MNGFTHDRKFGVEIEALGLSRNEVAEVLQKVGIDVEVEDLHHNTRPYWKVVTDGSVRDGFELVSPILSGVEGLQEVEKVVKTLAEAGVIVDTRCGLHVHVDARDMTADSIYYAVKRYAENESTIDSFVKADRRSNCFACTMIPVERYLREAREERIFISAGILCNIAESQFNRYLKLNLCSYARHGTLEFRQHHGSMNSDEVVNWIVFCVTFIENCNSVQPNVGWWNKFSFSGRETKDGPVCGLNFHPYKECALLENLPDETVEFLDRQRVSFEEIDRR